MTKTELKLLKESIIKECEILFSGFQLMIDSGNYKKKITHGLSNQEYQAEIDKTIRSMTNIVTKMRVYEQVLSDTWKARLLKKANKFHKELLILKENIRKEESK